MESTQDNVTHDVVNRADDQTNPPEKMPDEFYDLALGEDGDLTPRFEAVLHQLFKKLDEDNSGTLNKEELNKFRESCNGKAFSDEELQDLENFQMSPEGDLTEGGFLDMYHLQTSADPEETWKDLYKLGFAGIFLEWKER